MSARPYRTRLAALAAGAALLLTGCGSVQAGTAAKVGSETIGASYVDEQIQEYLALAEEQTGGRSFTDDEVSRLRRAVVQQLILHELMRDIADRRGVSVSEAEIDETAQAMRDDPAGAPPPDMVDTVAYMVTAGEKLEEELGGERLQEELVAAADRLEVEVNPRFGQWTPRGVQPGGSLVSPLPQPEIGGVPQNQQ